jgi:hypothetical protein
MPSNIKVAVRVRPLLKHELNSNHSMDKIELNSEEKQIV